MEDGNHEILLFLVVLITVLLTAAATAFSQQIDPALQGFWTLNVEKSDFGDRPKPKMGQVNWGEHGWTFALLTADGRLYADGVATDRGCTLIGVSQNYSCEVEVVTPRHVRFTLRQGTTVRQVGDIELLENGTTRTTHRVNTLRGRSLCREDDMGKAGEEVMICDRVRWLTPDNSL